MNKEELNKKIYQEPEAEIVAASLEDIMTANGATSAEVLNDDPGIETQEDGF